MKNLKSALAYVALASVAILVSGCASVTCGSRQDVALYSKPNGAEVIVYNNHGDVVYRGQTPCVAKLERTAPESGRANYIVLMKKQGCKPAQLQLKSVMNRAGLASTVVGAGLFVDSGTGGMWTLGPSGENPELQSESPDMLQPDGLCLALKDDQAPQAATTVAAKTDSVPAATATH
jgi:hypothetical protein